VQATRDVALMTGARIARPVEVASNLDPSTDYAPSVKGRPSYQDSEFRTGELCNVATDATNPTPASVALNPAVGARLSHHRARPWIPCAAPPLFRLEPMSPGETITAWTPMN
jgi:hypothetical protein